MVGHALDEMILGLGTLCVSDLVVGQDLALEAAQISGGTQRSTQSAQAELAFPVSVPSRA